jgi:hypothetical protein
VSFSELWTKAVKDTDAAGPDWDPDPGDYTVKVAAAWTETTSRGAEIAKLRLRILGGDHDGDGFTHALFFSGKFATEQSVRALRAYGLDVARVEDFDDLGRQLAAVVGVEADVTATRDGDRLRIQVNDARPGDQPAEIPDPDDADVSVPF